MATFPSDKASFPFAAWLPDQPALENPGSTQASNCRPAAIGYRPMPDIKAFTTAALDAFAQGAISVTDRVGAVTTYIGDAAKLYDVTSSAATDVSIAGGYSTASDGIWDFAKWANTVIATNLSEEVQTITIGGANFANLITSTDTPSARYVAVEDNGFVILGNISDESGVAPTRVRWSAQNDPTDFDEDAATLADKQDLQGGGGHIQGLLDGGDFVTIFRELSIHRMQFVGPPIIFQIDQVVTELGLRTPGAAAAFGRLHYFLASSGFYVFDGAQALNIGSEQVDRLFWDAQSGANTDAVDVANIHRVRCTVDADSHQVFWSYPTSDAPANACDRILCYDWVVKRWTLISINTQLIFRHLSEGYTLEGLDAISADIDNFPSAGAEISLDSKAWMGGAIKLGAVDTANKLATFEGDNLAAVMATGEFNLAASAGSPGYRSKLTEVISLVDGGTPTMRIGYRNLPGDNITWSSAVTQNASGYHPFLIDSRYFRSEVTVPAASTWTHAIGISAADFTVTSKN